jgi:hypothetical protein
MGTTLLFTMAGKGPRRRCVLADRRAEHTHLRYLEGLLAKEKAKLARVRQAGLDALAPSHDLMILMTIDKLCRLQENIKAAMAAIVER